MDIYCPRCAEPMDLSELHEFGIPFDEAQTLYFSKGCGVLFNGTPCEKVDSLVADASSALYDMLGDDVDGIASMMDDFAFMGMLDE